MYVLQNEIKRGQITHPVFVTYFDHCPHWLQHNQLRLPHYHYRVQPVVARVLQMQCRLVWNQRTQRVKDMQNITAQSKKEGNALMAATVTAAQRISNISTDVFTTCIFTEQSTVFHARQARTIPLARDHINLNTRPNVTLVSRSVVSHSSIQPTIYLSSCQSHIPTPHSCINRCPLPLITDHNSS